jgi:hypothetical protein
MMRAERGGISVATTSRVISRCSSIVLALLGVTAIAHAAPAPAPVPDATAYPQVQVLRPPVFPVGVVEAGSELAVPTEGGAASFAVGARAGVMRDLEAGVAVVTALGDSDAGTRLRVRVDRAIYSSAHLELISTIDGEYDVAALTWTDSSFTAALTYRLGAVQARAGGSGLDAALDHGAAELTLPLAVGAQLGAHLYVEGCAHLVTGYDGDDGGHTALAPRALFAAVSVTAAFDVVAGIGAAAPPVAADEATAGDQFTLFAGASYRVAL